MSLASDKIFSEFFFSTIVLEECVAEKDCPKYQSELEILGQAHALKWKIRKSDRKWLQINIDYKKVVSIHTEQWSPGSYSYGSEDYENLADYLDDQICETGEQEDKVCCLRSFNEVGKQYRTTNL